MTSQSIANFLVEVVRASANFPVVDTEQTADPQAAANQELARRIHLIYRYEGGLADFFDRLVKEQAEYETSLADAAETRINRIVESASCSLHQRADSKSRFSA
jgi:hypothetical protein